MALQEAWWGGEIAVGANGGARACGMTARLSEVMRLLLFGEKVL